MSRVRDERIRQGLTLADLSRRTGITYSTLCNLEKGRCYAWPKYRRLISEALGVEESVLFGEEGKECKE
jgi:transcriptional regulator with XRE-family HTH domain